MRILHALDCNSRCACSRCCRQHVVFQFLHWGNSIRLTFRRIKDIVLFVFISLGDKLIIVASASIAVNEVLMRMMRIIFMRRAVTFTYELCAGALC